MGVLFLSPRRKSGGPETGVHREGVGFRATRALSYRFAEVRSLRDLTTSVVGSDVKKDPSACAGGSVGYLGSLPSAVASACVMDVSSPWMYVVPL